MMAGDPDEWPEVVWPEMCERNIGKTVPVVFEGRQVGSAVFGEDDEGLTATIKLDEPPALLADDI